MAIIFKHTGKLYYLILVLAFLIISKSIHDTKLYDVNTISVLKSVLLYISSATAVNNF